MVTRGGQRDGYDFGLLASQTAPHEWVCFLYHCPVAVSFPPSLPSFFSPTLIRFGCKEKPGDLKREEHVVHKLAETRVALLSGKYIFTTPHCPCLLLSSSPPLSPSSARSSYAHYLYSALPDGLLRAFCSDSSICKCSFAHSLLPYLYRSSLSRPRLTLHL